MCLLCAAAAHGGAGANANKDLRWNESGMQQNVFSLARQAFEAYTL